MNNDSEGQAPDDTATSEDELAVAEMSPTSGTLLHRNSSASGAVFMDQEQETSHDDDTAMQWAQRSTGEPSSFVAPSASMHVRVSQETPRADFLVEPSSARGTTSHRVRLQKVVAASTLQRLGYWDCKHGQYVWPHPQLRKRREAMDINSRRTRVSHRSLEGERARQRLEEFGELHHRATRHCSGVLLLTEREERRTITRTSSYMETDGVHAASRRSSSWRGADTAASLNSTASVIVAPSLPGFVYRRSPSTSTGGSPAALVAHHRNRNRPLVSLPLAMLQHTTTRLPLDGAACLLPLQTIQISRNRLLGMK